MDLGEVLWALSHFSRDSPQRRRGRGAAWGGRRRPCHPERSEGSLLSGTAVRKSATYASKHEIDTTGKILRRLRMTCTRIVGYTRAVPIGSEVCRPRMR